MPRTGRQLNILMAHVRKIVAIGGGPSTIDLSEYVGKYGDFIIDPDNGQILYQDGETPGGIVIGAGGSLTGLTITLETDPPNDSVNATLIFATGGSDDQDIVLRPRGAGAFMMSLPDGTSDGGDKRGPFASDLQVHQSGKNSSTQVASGPYSFASNVNNTASGWASHAEGSFSIASNFASHSEGSSTTASGNASHSEGNSTTASGFASHAEGYITVANADFSHAEGSSTTSSGNGSHAEGVTTTASSEGAHSEGSNTTASGTSAHAEGALSTASGAYSHAEGVNTLADASVSQASGQDSWTRGIAFYQVYSSGFFLSRGDQQFGRLGLKAHTTDGTETIMTTDGNAASDTNQLTVPTDSVISIVGTVLGCIITGDASMWSFAVCVKNLAGTLAFVGEPGAATVLAADGATSSYDVTFALDDATKTFNVIVRGLSGDQVYWTSELRTQELRTIVTP
jgi:hypothetical protein